jgi:hypothetical protein
MIPRLRPGLVALASVLLVSCYPVQENQPRKHKAGARPNPPAVTQTEQTKLNEQREKQQKAEDAKNRLTETNQPSTDVPAGTGEGTTPPDNGKKTEPRRVDYPVAQKAPGMEGFVLSPYNSKIIDVRDDNGKPRPKGTLLSDPTFQESEKKYFRVP